MNITIARTGRSSVDIKVDCFGMLAMTIEHEGRNIYLQLVVFLTMVGSSKIAAAVSSPIIYQYRDRWTGSGYIQRGKIVP